MHCPILSASTWQNAPRQHPLGEIVFCGRKEPADSPAQRSGWAGASPSCQRQAHSCQSSAWPPSEEAEFLTLGVCLPCCKVLVPWALRSPNVTGVPRALVCPRSQLVNSPLLWGCTLASFRMCFHFRRLLKPFKKESDVEMCNVDAVILFNRQF